MVTLLIYFIQFYMIALNASSIPFQKTNQVSRYIKKIWKHFLLSCSLKRIKPFQQFIPEINYGYRKYNTYTCWLELWRYGFQDDMSQNMVIVPTLCEIEESSLWWCVFKASKATYGGSITSTSSSSKSLVLISMRWERKKMTLGTKTKLSV